MLLLLMLWHFVPKRTTHVYDDDDMVAVVQMCI